VTDVTAAKPCPFLVEFAHLPGFPKNPLPVEKYSWNSRNRIEKFRERLADITAVATKIDPSVSVLFCRVMAAHLALSDVPYEPIGTEEESR